MSVLTTKMDSRKWNRGRWDTVSLRKTTATGTGVKRSVDLHPGRLPVISSAAPSCVKTESNSKASTLTGCADFGCDQTQTRAEILCALVESSSDLDLDKTINDRFGDNSQQYFHRWTVSWVFTVVPQAPSSTCMRFSSPSSSDGKLLQMRRDEGMRCIAGSQCKEMLTRTGGDFEGWKYQPISCYNERSVMRSSLSSAH